MNTLKRNWFILGLIGITLITLLESSGRLVSLGLFVKTNGGPNLVIIIIFFLSGLGLNTSQIREGIADSRGTLLALLLIFAVSPMMALPSLLASLPLGIVLGLLLVSVMPSTLSSGVVMTGAAGGNMAHALLVTIIANSLAVFSIPLILGLLLNIAGVERIITIDRLPIMLKIATLVLLPLSCGIAIRYRFPTAISRLLRYTGIINQLAILVIVWTALCAGRSAILAKLDSLLTIVIVVFIFHLAIIVCGLLLTAVFAVPKHRRESVVFMGGQKTLPLSVILQVSLFPEYGLALAVCVAHHIIHLIMDAFLIRYLQAKG